AEQGIALPGCTVVCADSHTCTLGGLGALAWGVGASDCEHALATVTLRVVRPRQMHVVISGDLPAGVTAKDMILTLIAEHTACGAAGHAIEFTGTTIDHLSLAARFTLCNMAVEFSAFTGIIAPDPKTLASLQGSPYAPHDKNWEAARNYWGGLKSDADAAFDKELRLDAARLEPTVTWGTSPQHAVSVTGNVPDPASARDAATAKAMQKALDYMGLKPGAPLEGLPIDCAFIGSCTNSRLEDLRQAAMILKDKKVADGVKAVCVPGSTPVKRAAEAEGLDRIFRAAGFEWRESGCSLCFYAGGESFGFRKRVVSSTNRNFEGRQGKETRTHLASPATAAASAIEGRIADPRKYLTASS
ncbi:MAG: 3-isopropylmalate dehydratase large subunit, partial [Gammaproteobacteria bacterium]